MQIIGTLFALPYVVLFFVVWIAASLFRPILTLSLICLATNPSAAIRKFQLLILTVQYLLFCNDKKWKTPKHNVEALFQANASKIERKTVIFVRHGESTWNDTFNKGDRSPFQFVLYFVPNLAKAVAAEWYFWVTGQADESWFFDSPLSDKGLRQATGIQTFLRSNLDYVTPKEAELIRLLVGDDNKVSAQLVSSNLRRAISTMIVGFQDRLHRKLPGDDIMIVPELQEISRNPDALSITPAHGKVTPAWTDPKPLHFVYEENRINTRLHTGNKALYGNGLQRLESFCHHVFEDIDKPAVIAAGHSLWFRSFFRTFLPQEFDHVSKKKKLINGGIVGFALERIAVDDNKNYAYRIDPTSIVVLHGGF